MVPLSHVWKRVHLWMLIVFEAINLVVVLAMKQPRE